MSRTHAPRPFALGLAFVLTGIVAGCSGTAAPSSAATADDEALAAVPQHPSRAVCASAVDSVGYRCLSTVRTDLPAGFTPDLGRSAKTGGTGGDDGSGDDDDDDSSDAGPAQLGYGPADLVSAYSIPDGGEGITVAVIDYQDDPSAEADLAFYRASYRLPPCTAAGGCFRKVNTAGASSPLPAASFSSAIEISVDIEAVSAACPACKILLVEADAASTSSDPLGDGVDAAVRLGATFVSVSYALQEVSDSAPAGFGMTKTQALANRHHYVHPGVAIFASTGDGGFAISPSASFDGKGPMYPSDIPEVFAVGGTRLVKSSRNARGWVESAWGPYGGAGNSGCSAFFPRPAYQTSTACIGRETADLSAVADDQTGFATYITYTSTDTASTDYFPRGWNVVGGTSVASPLTAAIFAASGLVGVDPSFVYRHAGDLHDVTTGRNGTCKEPSLCNARSGYDGPTGNGTPSGSLLRGQ